MAEFDIYFREAYNFFINVNIFIDRSWHGIIDEGVKRNG